MFKTFVKRRSLGVQLVALLTVALFPLGLISLYQTRAVLEEVNVVRFTALMERTSAAATAEQALIRETIGAAQGLGVALKTAGLETCSTIMSDFVSGDGQAAFAGFITPAGRMACTSTGTAHDLAGTEIFKRLRAAPGPIVEVTNTSDLTGAPVILVADKVRQNGALKGFVAIAIPHRFTETLLPEASQDDGLQMAALSAGGHLISASTDSESAALKLPKGLTAPMLFSMAGRSFMAKSGAGERRIYAVTSMIPDSIILVGSRPARSVFAQNFPLFFPVLMWMTGLAVAFFGLQHLVIRHMTALREAMRQFSLGELSGRQLTLDNPPEELRETEHAFNQMTYRLARAEAQQEQDLRDKEVLLKEVHHRVKNNLQLVASIMSLQARSAQAPETRRSLASLQRRVRGLAMLHRTLYTAPETACVNVAELVEAVVKDVTSAGAVPSLDVTTHLQDVDLFPDQAVPLSMLLSEAVTNAMKYVGKPVDDLARITVSLTEDSDGMVCLKIENTLGTPLVPINPDDPQGDGLGQRLMRAFVSQLEGRSDVTVTDTMYTLDFSFKRHDFNAQVA